MKWKGKLNKSYTQISLYVIITALIIYALTKVIDGTPNLLGYAVDRVNWLMRVIKPIIIGFVFAYLFEPVVAFFQRRLEKRKRYKDKPKKARFHSVVITIMLIFIAVVGMISVLVYSITKQIRLANMEDIVYLFNTYVKYFTDFIDSLIVQLKDLNIETKEFQTIIASITARLSDFATKTVNSTAGSIGNITGVVTTFAFSLIIGIWFMIDGAMITSYLNKVMYAICNQKFNKKVHDFLHDADEVFSGYIRGQLLDAAVMMVLISVSLYFVGVNFAIVIGVIAGFGNLVPYLGPFIAYGGSTIVCLISGDFKTLVFAIIVLFIIQTIDGNFIGPKLLSKAIEVHPLLVIVSLIFGSAIGGFLGMLLAVPVGALLKLLFVRYIDAKVEKKDAYLKALEEENAMEKEAPKCTIK